MAKENETSQTNVANVNLHHSGLLRRHTIIHSGEKWNKCNQCDFASVLADHLTTHMIMKTHAGENLFKCNQCDYASVGAGDLREHLKMHSGKKSQSATNATMHQFRQVI